MFCIPATTRAASYTQSLRKGATEMARFRSTEGGFDLMRFG